MPYDSTNQDSQTYEQTLKRLIVSWCTMLTLLSLVLFVYPTNVLAQSSPIVSEPQLKDYAQSFLSQYQTLMQGVPEANRTSFRFYPLTRYATNAVISSTHGAALEFRPSKSESFAVRVDNRKVEQAIFDLPRSEYFAAYGVGNSIGSLILDVEFKNVANVLDVGDKGSVLMDRTTVNGKAYNYPILIKGSNEEINWTVDEAMHDAVLFFTGEMLHSVSENTPRDYLNQALKQSQSVVSREQIYKLAEHILAKEISGEYKTPDERRSDWANLVETAKNLAGC